MFDHLRKKLALERETLVELLASGNMKDQYDMTCGAVLAIDKVGAWMTEIETALAKAELGEDDED
jgi:hypothetical protein